MKRILKELEKEEKATIIATGPLTNVALLLIRIACRWFVQGELWRRRIYELLQGIPASAISGNAVLKTPTGL